MKPTMLGVSSTHMPPLPESEIRHDELKLRTTGFQEEAGTSKFQLETQLQPLHTHSFSFSDSMHDTFRRNNVEPDFATDGLQECNMCCIQILNQI